MQAFHSDPAVKAAYLTRVRYHTQMNHLSKDHYYITEPDGRVQACALGAMTHDPSGGHARFPAALGIPETIAHLIDEIFEQAARAYSRAWPARVLEAIPVGADLRGVPYRLVLWLLGTTGHDAWSLTNARGLETLDDVASLYRARIAGEAVAPAAWADAYADALLAARRSWAESAELAAAHAAAAAARRIGHRWPVEIADFAVCARTAHLVPSTASRHRHALWAATGDRLLALLAAAPMAREARPAPTDTAGRAIRAILG